MLLFYYDEDGKKQGPVSAEVLKVLAKSGIITRETIIETENGKTAPARKCRGLEFSEQIKNDISAGEKPTEGQSDDGVSTPEKNSDIYGISEPVQSQTSVEPNPFCSSDSNNIPDSGHVSSDDSLRNNSESENSSSPPNVIDEPNPFTGQMPTVNPFSESGSFGAGSASPFTQNLPQNRAAPIPESSAATSLQDQLVNDWADGLASEPGKKDMHGNFWYRYGAFLSIVAFVLFISNVVSTGIGANLLPRFIHHKGKDPTPYEKHEAALSILNYAKLHRDEIVYCTRTEAEEIRYRGDVFWPAQRIINPIPEDIKTGDVIPPSGDYPKTCELAKYMFAGGDFQRQILKNDRALKELHELKGENYIIGQRFDEMISESEYEINMYKP